MCIAQRCDHIHDLFRLDEDMHLAAKLFEGCVKVFLQSLDDFFEFFIHKSHRHSTKALSR